ncbi:hypothetical protein AB0E16_26085 [Streptomyces sp. NPDC047970]|uniref:hypothetical protein n=1 Tax=Streptomyces sp. NPDC047970 TaxID=3155481 RepID=UPI00341C031D
MRRTTPPDLDRAQDDWHATYRQLAVHPSTALRRRLIHLSATVVFHPHWQGQRSAGWAALHGGRPGRTAS